jgi:hypothetical protein
MFWKYYQDGRKRAVDLSDLYEGQHCFLLGGAPTLNHYDLAALKTNGIVTIGINNVPTIFKPTYWIGADKPRCYSKEYLYDPSIVKFACNGKADMEIDGIKWKYFPSTLFWDAKEEFTINNLLHRTSYFVWWKNTWYNAIQLCYRLGFRTIYTLGADFKIDKNYEYAWNTSLSEKEVNSNRRLYLQTVNKMRELKPHFDEMSLKIINCSKTSSLIDDYGYLSYREAIEKCASIIPKHNTLELPHSLRKTEDD